MNFCCGLWCKYYTDGLIPSSFILAKPAGFKENLPAEEDLGLCHNLFLLKFDNLFLKNFNIYASVTVAEINN